MSAGVFPCVSVWLQAEEMHLNEALYLQIPLQLKATGGHRVRPRRRP